MQRITIEGQSDPFTIAEAVLSMLMLISFSTSKAVVRPSSMAGEATKAPNSCSRTNQVVRVYFNRTAHV